MWTKYMNPCYAITDINSLDWSAITDIHTLELSSLYNDPHNDSTLTSFFNISKLDTCFLYTSDSTYPNCFRELWRRRKWPEEVCGEESSRCWAAARSRFSWKKSLKVYWGSRGTWFSVEQTLKLSSLWLCQYILDPEAETYSFSPSQTCRHAEKVVR